MSDKTTDQLIDENNKRATTSAETAARVAKRLRKFGPNPVCCQCGNANVVVLVPLESTEHAKVINVLDAHHVVGRNHHPNLTVPKCRNCHAISTEALRAGGVPMQRQQSFAETLIACLTALAVFFRELADAFILWSERIRTEGLSFSGPGSIA